jgi:2-polyprenyl-3-methyl-5-hydroxy-6-metoxy-1,4-benzoquinol methylase
MSHDSNFESQRTRTAADGEPAGSGKIYAERPGWGPDFDYDEGRHLAAYLFAARFAAGRSVLDAGCGEGFGTKTLSKVARQVLGIDYSEEAIASARALWKYPNLEFRTLDFTDPRSELGTFDLVLNFQVLEHIVDDLAFVRSLARCVAPGGTLLMTTPNALHTFSPNPCHVREYRSEELHALLSRVFDDVELLGTFGNEDVLRFDSNRRAAVQRILRLDPLGLRHLLPQRLLLAAFAQLGRLVRRQAHRAGNGRRLSAQDFEIRQGELSQSIDLVAVCRR